MGHRNGTASAEGKTSASNTPSDQTTGQAARVLLCLACLASVRVYARSEFSSRTTAVTGPPQKKDDFKIGVIGGSGSPLGSAAFLPAHIQVNIVEIGIIQIAAMPNDAAGWQ